jgi:hypothetical protein
MNDKAVFNAFADILDEAIEAAHRLLKHFKVAPRTKPQKLYLMIVLNEIARKSGSVLAMARADANAGINVVTRSAFESYADLLNLLRYKRDYVTYMSWASLNQQRTVLAPLASGSKEIYESFKKEAQRLGLTPEQMAAETQNLLDEYESNLPALFKNRQGRVNPRDKLRFELAGLEKQYDSLYRQLSGGAHGRISAMIDGIAKVGHVQWPPTEPEYRPSLAIQALCSILLESARRVAIAYKKPVEPFRHIARKQAKLSRKVLESYKGENAKATALRF